MNTLKQRIEHYLQEAKPSGHMQVSEADYSEYMRERDEIESGNIEKSLETLKQYQSHNRSRSAE